jgi:predicted anti-sigma-YlaC factor YlaD
MNCTKALAIIAAGQDTGGTDGNGPQFEAHLATCPSCRLARSNLAAALAAWRSETAQTATPDPAREWRALQRRRREEAETDSTRPWAVRGLRWAWFAVPAAAALVALVVLRTPVGPGDSSGRSTPASAIAARADAVEAPGGSASTMVFVDDKSGWLIVWATDAGGRSG